jgi:large subunit ribosomal protein L25
MPLTIDCQKRPDGSKPNALRRDGKIPATLYGHNGTESLHLVIDAKQAGFLVRDASVNNSLIQVNIPDLSWNGKALLREVQKHPWRGYLYHLSFFSVAAHGEIEVSVPLNFVGDAVGVKNEGGTLDAVLTELAVKCNPESIPDKIDVDVSALKVGDALHVNELKLPSGVEVLGESDRVVVMIAGISTAATSEAAEEEAASAAAKTV